MRTLVIHTAFLGDLILLTPLIEALHQDVNTEWIGLLTTPACKSLFKGDPRIDELIIYDKKGEDKGLSGLKKVISRVRAQHPDRVISPHRSLRSALITWFSGAWERIGFSSATGSLAFTELVYDNRDLHEVDRNLSLVGLARPDKTRMPSICNNAHEEASVRDLLDSLGVVLPVAMAPASVWATKRWMPSYFGELADGILEATPADILLLGGPDDEELCRHVASSVSGFRSSRVHVLAGKLGLRESYQILRQCCLAIVNDSAPLHLAQAAGIPTFAVFGSTVPGFGFGPQGAQDRVFQADLDCIPCGIHGHKVCPLGTLACMEQVLPAELLEAATELISLAHKLPAQGQA